MSDQSVEISRTRVTLSDNDFLYTFHDFKKGKPYIAVYRVVTRKVYDRHLKTYVEKTALEETVFTYNNGRIEKVPDEELWKFVLTESLVKSVEELNDLSKILKNFPTSVKDDVRLSDVYRKVVDSLKKRVSLQSEADYTLVALWVIGSYFFPVFDYFPYLSVQSLREKDRAQFLLTLSDLLPRAVYVKNYSPSLLLTLVSSYKASLVIDKLDEMFARKYLDKVVLMLTLCDNRRGVIVREKEGKGGRRTIAGYECFSPKAFVDQYDITSKYDIASRSVFVKVPPQDKSPDHAIENQSLVDELYSVFLRYASEVDRLYRDPDFDSGFTWRYDQTFRPLIVIAKLIDREDSTLQAEDKLRSALRYTVDLVEPLKVEEELPEKIIGSVKDYIIESLKDVIIGSLTEVPRPWHVSRGSGAIYIYVKDLRNEVKARVSRSIASTYRAPKIEKLFEPKKFVALLKTYFPQNVKTYRERPVFVITPQDIKTLMSKT